MRVQKQGTRYDVSVVIWSALTIMICYECMDGVRDVGVLFLFLSFYYLYVEEGVGRALPLSLLSSNPEYVLLL